jgi:cytochrome c-type biogenesis protein CcmE
MERLFVLLVSILLAMGIVAGCSSKSDDVKALSVRGIKTDSAAYQGTITIAGVVAMVSRNDPKMFAVMDLDDVKNSVPLPQRLFMSVHYEGAIPAVGEAVTITGSFKEGFKYFAATNVKPRR